MRINKAILKSNALALTSLFIIVSFNGKAQFFDFETYNGSEERNTMPSSILGNENITLKALDFSGDTLWAGTYKDGMMKWWADTEKSTAWIPINMLEGNEVYNIKAQASTRVFYTDFNSFTNEYLGFYRLVNQDRLFSPIIKKIELAGNDTTTAQPLNKVNDIEIIGDTLVLLATDSGLVMFDGEKRWRFRNPDNIGPISKWKIDQVCANSKGELYFSSGTNIFREIDGKWENIDLSLRPYRLRDTYVKSLKTGPNDTIWAVTPLGIAKIHTDTILVWRNEEIKDRQNEVRDVAFDSIGNPWLIFELNGGIMFLDESTGSKKWLRINSTNSDLPDELSCIARDKSGNLWLGSDNDGLFKYLSYTPGSLNNNWPNDVNLYPTISANGQFVIEGAYNDLNFEVYNLQGKLVLSGLLNRVSNQSFNLETGNYIVTIFNNEIRSSKMIVALPY